MLGSSELASVTHRSSAETERGPYCGSGHCIRISSEFEHSRPGVRSTGRIRDRVSAACGLQMADRRLGLPLETRSLLLLVIRLHSSKEHGRRVSQELNSDDIWNWRLDLAPIRAEQLRPRPRAKRRSRTGGRVAAALRPRRGRGPHYAEEDRPRLFGGNAAEVGPGKHVVGRGFEPSPRQSSQLCSLRPNRAVTSRRAMRR